MASSTETTLLRAVTPQDIFNLPLNEHHLVIDTRTHGEYTAGHIATAVSLPSPCVDCSEAEREKQLVQFIKAYIKEYVRYKSSFASTGEIAKDKPLLAYHILVVIDTPRQSYTQSEFKLSEIYGNFMSYGSACHAYRLICLSTTNFND